MRPPPAMKKKKSASAPATIMSLGHDTLSFIFSFLGLFDLVHCSVVCKSWNSIIKRPRLLRRFYIKQKEKEEDEEEERGRMDISSGMGGGSTEEESMKMYLEGLGMEHHRRCLVGASSSVQVHQWKAHSTRVDQCRMKMGLLLTGVGDKVMRLWSLESYKCMGEYSTPDSSPLVDFDFDESKIVGLIGTRLCIWRRNGQRSIFPSKEGTFTKGLCMRYFDPEAVVGCEDGTARVFDMYSRKCSQIIRMHAEPVTCLSLSDDQLIIGGSSLGRITVSGISSDQRLATLRNTDLTGIKSLCFNPRSHLLFSGTTAGFISCWDLRTMRKLWETRASTNVLYSLQHLRGDTSTLILGGLDGILRIMDQNTGEVLSSYVMGQSTISNSSGHSSASLPVAKMKGQRLANDAHVDGIPKTARPPIKCLAVGMKKVVTTHNGKYVRVWRFNSRE